MVDRMVNGLASKCMLAGAASCIDLSEEGIGLGNKLKMLSDYDGGNTISFVIQEVVLHLTT